MHTIAVTGVTGRVGSRVARSLSDAGIATRLVGRNPEKLPDLPGAVAAPTDSYRAEYAAGLRLAARMQFVLSIGVSRWRS